MPTLIEQGPGGDGRVDGIDFVCTGEAQGTARGRAAKDVEQGLLHGRVVAWAAVAGEMPDSACIGVQ